MTRAPGPRALGIFLLRVPSGVEVACGIVLQIRVPFGEGLGFRGFPFKGSIGVSNYRVSRSVLQEGMVLQIGVGSFVGVSMGFLSGHYRASSPS